MKVEPGKPTAEGPANWFTGQVWIDPIASGHGPAPRSLGNVHFAPGARTAWHSHAIAQTLYVTEGEGLVQSHGEPGCVFSDDGPRRRERACGDPADATGARSRFVGVRRPGQSDVPQCREA